MNLSKMVEQINRAWKRVAGQARRAWRFASQPEQPDAQPPRWLYPATGVLLAVLILAVTLLLVVPAVRAVVSGVEDALAGGAGWLRTSDLANVVLGPVRDYLTAHSFRVKVGADTIWWSWCAFGIGSFALSFLFRNVGARIGWALWGAATVAMVWVDPTAGVGRSVAAGIAAAWWCAFSVFAYRRQWGRPRVVAWLPQFRALDRWLDHREDVLEQRIAHRRAGRLREHEAVGD